MYEHINWLFLL